MPAFSRLLLGVQLAFFLLRAKEDFHHRNEQRADQARRKAAVIQQEPAVGERYACDKAVVEHGKDNPGKPAVISRNRAQAVCKAQTDDDGLRIDSGCKVRPERRAERLRQKRRRDIADHDWPDVCRMASLEAAADHAQHAPKRRRVPFRADQIIVQHNEKAVDGKVQNRRARAVFRAVIRADARIL